MSLSLSLPRSGVEVPVGGIADSQSGLDRACTAGGSLIVSRDQAAGSLQGAERSGAAVLSLASRGVQGNLIQQIWRAMDRGGATSAGSADPPAKGCPKSEASDEAGSADGPKCCTDCRTTKTPLWRGGPSGPKSLCNACGIRYRKRRREMLGLKSRSASDKARKEKLDHGSSGAAKVSVVRKKRPRSLLWLKRRRRRQLGEEEQAAILLMALSTGFLYA